MILLFCATLLAATATPAADTIPKAHFGHALDHEVVDGVIGLRFTRIGPRSPADRAGLRRGDRLIAIDGQPLGFANELEYIHYLLDLEPGVPLEYTILRDGREMAVTIVPAPFPEESIEAYRRYYRDLVDCHEHGKCDRCSKPRSPRPPQVKTLKDWLEEDGLRNLRVERVAEPERWRITSPEVAGLPQDPSELFDGEPLEQILQLRPGETISYSLEEYPDGYILNLEDLPKGLPLRVWAARKAAKQK